MNFVKDYKNVEALRLSFCALAQDTFGISFEPWYQAGYWTDAYMPYSFEVDGKVVANASANLMTLVIEGSEICAIQIGTVMTDPDYRRRGLAYKLIGKIIEEYKDKVSFFYLAADEEAVALYKKCGFEPIPEVKYTWQNPIGVGVSLDPVSHSLEALIELKRNSVLKGAKLEVTEDEHIFAFYYHHGFDKFIYQLDSGVVLLAETKNSGKELTLYDYFVPKSLAGFSLLDMLESTGAQKVHFAFDVGGLAVGLEKRTIADSGWMVRAKDQAFPEAFSYKTLAQA
jgi:GNAT superfamily N-acetyltransferase